MEKTYRWLFEPLELTDGISIKNRIVSTAHGTGYDQDGIVTEKYIRYEARKAAGGAGLLGVFGSASVDPVSAAPFGSVRLWDAANERLFTKLTEEVHTHGALVLCQATHMGRRGITSRSGGLLAAPSAVPEPVHREIPHAMSTNEAEQVIEHFAAAAHRLESCGFDGIEIQGGGGQLLEQFLSPELNHRTDRFGGDIDARMRFAIEVVEAISAATSANFIVGMRLSANPGSSDFGLTAEDMLHVAQQLDARGKINVFSISGSPAATFASTAGSIPSSYFPLGTNLAAARSMKSVLRAPVLVAGRVLTPDQGEQALAAGDCDLVGMTRAMIADPELAHRARSGREDRVRPCISINEGCIGRLYSGLEVRCVVNPAIAEEELIGVPPAPRSKRVVVVGGGPAGMEAARAAAARGHVTTLLESANRLGGQLSMAARIPEAPLYSRYVTWLQRELAHHNVAIKLNTPACHETALSEDPHEVVLAVGCDSVVPPETSGSTVRCITDVDVLDGRAKVPESSTVLVYDREGHKRGGSLALWACEAGAAYVELATDMLRICEHLDQTQLAPMLSRLANAGVVGAPSQELVRSETSSIGLRDQWSRVFRSLERFDLAIFVGYRMARTELANSLQFQTPGPAIHVIGDAYAPRGLADAVHEGTSIGSRL